MLIVTASASCAQAKTVLPTASPALITLRRARSKRARGSGTAFIIIFSAVGNRKLLRTRYLAISASARSGSKRPRYPRTGQPK